MLEQIKTLTDLKDALMVALDSSEGWDYRTMAGIGTGETKYLGVWKSFPYQVTLEVTGFLGTYRLSQAVFYEFNETSTDSKPNLIKSYKLSKDILDLEDVSPIFEEVVGRFYRQYIY